MELRHLRYFVELASQLHFGRAAERLNIVQPALSMQIKALEGEVGVPLFLRSQRMVELTPAGAAFLEEARLSLAHANHAVEVARQVSEGALGRLRIGFSAGAVQSGIFADLVGRLRAAHPRVVIEPREAHPRLQFEMLLAGEFDAAIGTSFAPIPPGLGAKRLGHFAPRLVLPPDHALAEQKAIAPAALRNERFIGYAGPGDVEGFEMTAQVLGFVPDIAFTVSSPTTAIGMVAAGLGLAVVPDSLVGVSDAVFRPLKDVNVNLDVMLLWPLAQTAGVAARLLEVVD